MPDAPPELRDPARRPWLQGGLDYLAGLEVRTRELEAVVAHLEQYIVDLSRSYGQQRHFAERLLSLHRAQARIGALTTTDDIVAALFDALDELVPCAAELYLRVDAVEQSAGITPPAGNTPSICLFTRPRVPGRPTRGRVSARLASLDVAAAMERTMQGGQTVTHDLHAQDAPVLHAVEVLVPLQAPERSVGVLRLLRSELLTADDKLLVELLAGEGALALYGAQARASGDGALDPLPNPGSRGPFYRQLDLEIARARRASYPVGVLLLALDDAHQASSPGGMPNEVLRRLTQQLRDELRRTDVLARVGADTFAVIAPGASREGLAALAERMRRAAETVRVRRVRGASGRPGAAEVPLALSAGGASLAAAELDPTRLVLCADLALAEAKEAGTGAVHLWGRPASARDGQPGA